MIYELDDTSKVQSIFDGWEETLIYSCLQKVMGKIYVTNLENPDSAFAFVGCFGFFAGKPNKELVMNKPKGFVILTPQNKEWVELIEACYPNAQKNIRYAIKKDTKFDVDALQKIVDDLPSGYELKRIDSCLYDICLEKPFTRDFVSSFESKESFLKIGRGVVILKDGEIVSGASSYTRYEQGIEIEIDTIESERRKNLATIAGASLILMCLKEGLYPSWDAQNTISIRLAEKLGYEFDHEYIVYELEDDN